MYWSVKLRKRRDKCRPWITVYKKHSGQPLRLSRISIGSGTGRLLFRDSFGRASACAGTAGDALVSVNYISVVACRDSLNGALTCAGTAGDTYVFVNFVSHFFKILKGFSSLAGVYRLAAAGLRPATGRKFLFYHVETGELGKCGRYSYAFGSLVVLEQSCDNTRQCE